MAAVVPSDSGEETGTRGVRTNTDATDGLISSIAIPHGSSSKSSFKEGIASGGGVYLVKFAVSIGAVYLAIGLLIEFAEVLLPFIFAVLLMLILEPLKKCVVRVTSELFILLVTVLCLRRFCLQEVKVPRRVDEDEALRVEERLPSEHRQLLQRRPPSPGGERPDVAYVPVRAQRGFSDVTEDTSLTSDNSSGQQQKWVLTPGMVKLILTGAIIFCMIFIGRALWLVVKAFIKAGEVVSYDIEYYQRGAARLKGWFQLYVHSLHAELINWDPLVDDLVKEVKEFAEDSTSLISDLLFQAVVTFIFLLYLLWSPIKIEKNSMTQEAYRKAGKFLTIKTATSFCVGLAVFISLWLVGMPIPAAFGLLAFLLNFLPGVGSVIATILPCGLGLLDFRIGPGRVVLALVTQVVLHVFFDYFIEPIFFGLSAEVHSVVVILGIAFFGKIWGVPGMLISVPLMAVARLILRASKTGWASDASGTSGSEEDAADETVLMLDAILEGRWMSSVEGTGMSRHSVTRVSDAEEASAAPGLSVWDTALGRLFDSCYSSHKLAVELVGLLTMVTLVFML
mmetsp:Transcript_69249/g.129287  ORF Transcript_69249/g.129287 Transcript_69249/m.129287 type:complete len:566 (+) Transcript_69249:51-1748(+)